MAWLATMSATGIAASSARACEQLLVLLLGHLDRLRPRAGSPGLAASGSGSGLGLVLA